jgi:epoxyqueuosine reductase
MVTVHEETSALLSGWALEAGFDRAGVAVLKPVEHRAFFLDWLGDGLHAGMGYLARRVEARLDPRVLFPGARSAVCVALQYDGSDLDEGVMNDLWTGVARYARGDDYHLLMRGRLEALALRIEAGFPGTETRCYVDTGPVLERELAASAGLGAVGKNTCLLHPEAGSWFFLGEIFTSLSLGRVPGLVEDMCGSCSRCLDECPTGAFKEAYVLDSSLCISYWTIEHRGDIPTEVRPLLGHWIFGCDVCQEVCPHNEGLTYSIDESLGMRGERRELSLAGLLRLDASHYQELFRASPMKRSRLEGLKRNAIVAMGNSGSREYEDDLIEVLEKGSRVLRSHAAWALGRLGGTRSLAALEAARRRERNNRVSQEISEAVDSLVTSS